MASTIVTGAQPARVEADAADVEDFDAAPFDWNDGDGFEAPEDRFSSFFGPAHERPNRVVIATGAVIFAIALVIALVATVTRSGGPQAHASAPVMAVVSTHKHAPSAATRGAAALLALSDFPSGWTGAGNAAMTHGVAWSTKLASCVGVPASIAHATPTKVSSPVFTSGDKAAALEESVSVYPSAKQALAQYKAIANAKTPKCINSVGAATLRASIQSEAGSAATVGKVAITTIPKGILQPHETGIRVTIPLSTSAGQLTINSTEVDFVKGKLFEQLNFNGNGSPFPPLLEVQLINAAMHRAP